MEVVYFTFSRSHGITPGIVSHGYIDFNYFVSEEILPFGTIHAYINQLYVKCKNLDGEETEFELEHWGLSRNLASMCKKMETIEYPFVVRMTVDVHFGEYE